MAIEFKRAKHKDGTTSAPRVVKGSVFQMGDAVKIGESSSTIKISTQRTLITTC